jgi:hypothetical protein
VELGAGVGVDEPRQGGALAGCAEAAVPVQEEDGGWGFDCAVLEPISKSDIDFGKRNGVRTLQTTVPHRRHSPTMSRAQSPTLPTPAASLPASTKYQSAARARYRNVCSGSSPTSSFSQCSVDVRSWVRNCRRLART